MPIRDRTARTAVPVLTLLSLASALLACGGSTAAASTDGGSADGAGGGVHVVGAACTPPQEDVPAFSGSTEQEVNIADYAKNAPGADVCLENHFRGRVTCPYGQDAKGNGPTGAPPCKTPSGAAVTGNPNQPSGAMVQAQCVDRRASKAVHWSCRCANAAGKVDDGDAYCACPSSMTCTQLVSSIGNDHLSGAYCIHAGSIFDPNAACASSCDPVAANCP